MVQPTQRQVVDAAPRCIVLVLPQCCAGHSINRGFVDFHSITGFSLGRNQKTILLLTARDIAAKPALTATLKSRARYTFCVLAHKHAVAIAAACGLVQDTAVHAITQDFRADATVHQISGGRFGVSICGWQFKRTDRMLPGRCCFSRLNRNGHWSHRTQQPYCRHKIHTLNLRQIVDSIVAAHTLSVPVKLPICRGNNKAAVRFCAIFLVCFANKLAGMVGFEILHYTDAPCSLDIFLIFAHDDLRFLK